jgi:hypothetical protein
VGTDYLREQSLAIGETTTVMPAGANNPRQWAGNADAEGISDSKVPVEFIVQSAVAKLPLVPEIGNSPRPAIARPKEMYQHRMFIHVLLPEAGRSGSDKLRTAYPVARLRFLRIHLVVSNMRSRNESGERGYKPGTKVLKRLQLSDRITVPNEDKKRPDVGLPKVFHTSTHRAQVRGP